VENEFLPHEEDRYFLSDWYGPLFQPLGFGKIACVCVCVRGEGGRPGEI
jgi:hypothetical protein